MIDTSLHFREFAKRVGYQTLKISGICCKIQHFQTNFQHVISLREHSDELQQMKHTTAVHPENGNQGAPLSLYRTSLECEDDNLPHKDAGYDGL